MRPRSSRSSTSMLSAPGISTRRRGSKGSSVSCSAPSNHAVGFYPRATPIDHTALPRPDSRYGLSKCWGEAVAALYAQKHDIRSLLVRIGNADDVPKSARALAIWISGRDLAQLCRIGLEHPDVFCDAVYGVSNNAASWYDNSLAYQFRLQAAGPRRGLQGRSYGRRSKIVTHAGRPAFHGRTVLFCGIFRTRHQGLTTRRDILTAGSAGCVRPVMLHLRLDGRGEPERMLFLYLFYLYVGIGLAVAIAFAFAGVTRVQPQPMTAGARLLLIPGAAALWPYILLRWIRASAS